jgi:2-methylcitrate dehydratase PrpD
LDETHSGVVVFADEVAAVLQTLPARAHYADDLARARHCVLDWLGCTLAGSASEPSVRTRAALLSGTSIPPASPSTVVGTSARAGARDAALLNGAAAHALDFDDGHAWMGAHPSAPIVSAAAALAEAVDARGDKLLAAVVAGVHAGTMLSLALGHGHYVVGWHPTGTVGAVAAAAACAAILDLGVAETAVALNHAAAQAAGARIVFGSMAKPLNAGNAAANGVQATLLAQAGVTVTSDVVDGAQGVAAIYGGDWDPGRFDAITGGASTMADVRFKVHACCGATHPTINALLDLRSRGDLVPDEVVGVEVAISDQVRSMCRHDRPQDGLQAKFSLTHAAALVLAGRSTAVTGFTDAMVADPAIERFRRLVSVEAEGDRSGMDTEVRVQLRGGGALVGRSGSRAPTPGPEESRALEAKFRALAAPVVGTERAEEILAAARGMGPAGGPVADLLGLTATTVGRGRDPLSESWILESRARAR